MKTSEAKASRFLINNVPVHIEGNTLFPEMHKSLISLLDQHAAEQREACAEAAFVQCELLWMNDYDTAGVLNACLNAVKKSNEALPPYIAVGNNELVEELGEEILCPHCDKTHEVQYGTDEDGNETRILAFYKCDVTGKSYVAGIDGKRIK